jgi:flagellar biosynthesis component FlhA
MNKKIAFCLTILVVGSLPAMQQKQKQKNQQKQEKDRKKQHWYSNDKKDSSEPAQSNKELEQPVTAPAADQTTDDLNAMISVIMNQIKQQHGSVTNMIENLKHKEHERICPTCGRPAEICEADKDRIAHGNVMLCGCPVCGGLQV